MINWLFMLHLFNYYLLSGSVKWQWPEEAQRIENSEEKKNDQKSPDDLIWIIAQGIYSVQYVLQKIPSQLYILNEISASK